MNEWYEVQYGESFNVKCQCFPTAQEAYEFINSHYFGNLSICGLRKVESIPVKFPYMDWVDIEDKAVARVMHDTGIIEKLEVSKSDKGGV